MGTALNWVWAKPRAHRRPARCEHLYFALLPVVVGLVLAIPLGWLANRTRVGRSDARSRRRAALHHPVAGAVRRAPAAPGHPDPGPDQRDRRADHLHRGAAGPHGRRRAGRGPGRWSSTRPPRWATGPLRRFVAVELPLAVPVWSPGCGWPRCRTSAWSRVGALIGFGGLGELFTDGFQRDFPAEIVTGIVLVLLLALVVDAAAPAARPGAHPVGPGRAGPPGGAREPASRVPGCRPRALDGAARHPGPARSSTSVYVRAGAADRAGDRGADRRAGSGTPAAAASSSSGWPTGCARCPTLGLLVLIVVRHRASACSARSLALVVLAVPPILAGTYAGVRNVDPAVVDAARGMGMRGREVLLRRRAAERAAADHRRHPQLPRCR